MKARKRLGKILSEIINERKEKKLIEKGLLNCFLNAKDEKGLVLNEDQIADNIIGVLFAAQDTTASVLTWILKYLHDNPKLLKNVKVNDLEDSFHIFLSDRKRSARSIKYLLFTYVLSRLLRI